MSLHPGGHGIRPRRRRGPWRLPPLPLRALALATLALTAPRVPQVLSAQAEEPSDGPLELTVDPQTGALTVRLGDLLRDAGLRRALASGLPLRLRLVAELWEDGLFDDQEGSAEWRGTVVYEPLEGRYRIESRGMDTLRTVSPTLQGARRALRRSVRMPLRPPESGRYYYLATLEVETLSLSDLEELQRWLRGDLAPVVSGEREAESAVARGVRRLVVRVLGLPARRARERTPTFRVGG